MHVCDDIFCLAEHSFLDQWQHESNAVGNLVHRRPSLIEDLDCFQAVRIRKIGLAARVDYIDNRDGLLGPAVRPGAGLPFSPDSNGDLGSITLTLNYKPAPNLKIQPEIRYDYTSYSSGLGVGGKKDRIIVGCGVTYMF